MKRAFALQAAAEGEREMRKTGEDSVTCTTAEAASAALVDAALRRFFAEHPPAARRICVAFSGGIDSVVLLHALHRCRRAAAADSQASSPGAGQASMCGIPGSESDEANPAGRPAAFALSALHVHHGLSPHADAWADFCAAFCRSLAVPLNIVRVEVPRDSGEGLEAAARRGRYRAFASVDADWLALAHHRDDQAETALLNLLRGAGVAGAAGMPALRALRITGGAPEKGDRKAAAIALIRPLLAVPRAAIERYAAAYGLHWVDDESNDSRRFRRNFLRHEILPALEKPFPGARQALARAAGHFAEAADLLAQLAQIDADAARLPSGRVGLAAFNRLPPARARNLLRHLWAEAGFRLPEARWLEEACRQLADCAPGAETCVTTAEGELRVYRGELYCLPRCAFAAPQAAIWCGEAEVAWGSGRVRFLPAVGSGIACHWLEELRAEGQKEWGTLRVRQGGERFRPHINRPRRAVRDLLQEAGVPPWERTRMPLLWIDGRLAWVGGLGVEAGFACASGEQGVLPVWQYAQALQP